ncbi:MAG TPA: PIN domain nuclease [Thermoanaerobaculia bacterium]|nr:PIN domain nuclease [Thermoanaerobaculia bacterium]
MILVDSNIWINAGIGLFSLEAATRGQVVAVCPPIVQELLQGTEDRRRYDLTRAVLAATRMLDASMPLERFEAAADIYLACRAKGFTIRSAHDCLIAACAIAHDVPVMSDDSDFFYMARVTDLRVLTRS